MTPESTSGSDGAGRGRRRAPEEKASHTEAQRSGFGLERRRKGAGEGGPEGVPNRANFAPTKEQGVSRMLTINLNDVEKELNIR